MIPISRIGDQVFGIYLGGEGHPHSAQGSILIGSGNIFANFRGMARIGDTGAHSDGIITLIGGSAKVFVNFRGVSRLGDYADMGPGPGSVIAASPNVYGG